MIPDEDMRHAKYRPHGGTPSVAVLMCTMDGERFLDEQLQSFADQTNSNWTLFVSDDGSTDATKEILKTFADSHSQNVVIKKGPGKGANVNFLTLATDVTIDADYYAFSDQDDIWYKDKLDRALTWLSTVPNEVPALYCGRSELIAVDGRPFGYSPLFTRPPSFRNALVQSLGGGNTMLFNRAAKKLLSKSSGNTAAFYDWWMYQLISAAGGAIRYDPKPVLKYRQHPRNLIGSNRGLRARMVRVRTMLNGTFRDWNTANIAALRLLPADCINPQNKEILEAFARVRNASLLGRFCYLAAPGVYRQTFLDNIGILVAILLKRI